MVLTACSCIGGYGTSLFLWVWLWYLQLVLVEVLVAVVELWCDVGEGVHSSHMV